MDKGYKEEWYKDEDKEAVIVYLDMKLGLTNNVQINEKGSEEENDNRLDEQQTVGQTSRPVDRTNYGELCIAAEEWYQKAVLRIRAVRRTRRIIRL